jgi:hypothetical protein
MDKEPMPLENLPEYLKSHNTGGGVLVDVGNITTPTKPYMKWAAAGTMAMVLGISIATYHVMSNKELTVFVDTNQPQMLSQIVADGGGEMLAAKQTEGTTYEVKVATRKSKHSFLEWLRKNKDVKKAE